MKKNKMNISGANVKKKDRKKREGKERYENKEEKKRLTRKKGGKIP